MLRWSERWRNVQLWNWLSIFWRSCPREEVERASAIRCLVGIYEGRSVGGRGAGGGSDGEEHAHENDEDRAGWTEVEWGLLVVGKVRTDHDITRTPYTDLYDLALGVIVGGTLVETPGHIGLYA